MEVDSDFLRSITLDAKREVVMEMINALPVGMAPYFLLDKLIELNEQEENNEFK